MIVWTDLIEITIVFVPCADFSRERLSSSALTIGLGLMQHIPTPSICHLQQYIRKDKREVAGGLERSSG
jgi:hypothetical protein